MLIVTPTYSLSGDATGLAGHFGRQFPGFKFLGPGFYLWPNCTVLIVPYVDDLQQSWQDEFPNPDSMDYRAHVYFGYPFSETIFAMLASAPIKMTCDINCGQVVVAEVEEDADADDLNA